jgi:hypothetical protein
VRILPLLRHNSASILIKSSLATLEKDITMDMLISNFQSVLYLMSAESLAQPVVSRDRTDEGIDFSAEPSGTYMSPGSRSLSQEAREDLGAITVHGRNSWNDKEPTDECIICFDRKIDCVAVREYIKPVIRAYAFPC